MTEAEDYELSGVIARVVYSFGARLPADCDTGALSNVIAELAAAHRHQSELRAAERMREHIAAWLRNMTASEWNAMMAGKEHLPWAYGVSDAIKALDPAQVLARGEG